MIRFGSITSPLEFLARCYVGFLSVLLTLVGFPSSEVVSQTWTAFHPTIAPVTALTVSHDGKRILIGSQEGTVSLDADRLDNATIFKSQIRNVHDIRFIPDGSQLILAGGRPGEEGSTETFAWPDLRPLASRSDHEDVIYQISVAKKGDFVSASWDGTCKVFRNEKPFVEYKGHSGPVLSAVWLDDNQSVASCGLDQTIQVWDSQTGQRIRSLDNHTDTVHCLALKPQVVANGTTWLASAGEDRTIRFWQPTIGRMVRFIKLPKTARAIVWLPDGSRLLAACDDRVLRSINPETLAIAESPLPENTGMPYRLLLSTDGKSIYIGCSRGIGKWNLRDQS